MPLSVSPESTWLSALSLLPPVAVFLGVLSLGYDQRRKLALLVLGVGVVSVFIGLLQVAQGPHSSLRFFDFTNNAEAVGFFANRNHFAALIYALTLVAATLAADAALGAAVGKNWRQYDSVLIIAVIAFFIVIVVLLSGQAMARSRTGLLLTMLGLFGAFGLGVSDRRVIGSFSSGKLMIGASALAVVFAFQVALLRILDRFAFDPLENARWTFLGNTIDAAKDYMPFGSGMGSFVPVYGLYEKPAEVIANKYVNHAHNDFAELLLETGVPGVALLVLFVIWFAFRSRALWRSAPPSGTQEIDWSLARASSIIVVLLLVHSIFDYPLRTCAMMSIFAMACAFMVRPLSAKISEPLRLGVDTPKRARPPELAAQATPALTKPFTPTTPTPKPSDSFARLRPQSAVDWPSASAPGAPEAPKPPATPASSKSTPVIDHAPSKNLPTPAKRWGADIEWPAEWRKAADRGEKPDTPKPKS
jgi:O-antigen ligase